MEGGASTDIKRRCRPNVNVNLKQFELLCNSHSPCPCYVYRGLIAFVFAIIYTCHSPSVSCISFFSSFLDEVPYSATMDSGLNPILIKIRFVFIDHQVSIELDNTSRRNSCRRVRNRWHLLLTLHNNPSLQEYRRPDLFIQKSPFAAFQVMIQKGIVQYNQCEGENDDKSGVEDIKL